MRLIVTKTDIYFPWEIDIFSGKKGQVQAGEFLFRVKYEDRGERVNLDARKPSSTFHRFRL